MRTPEQMMNQILSFAEQDSRIRLVGMEGSRVNTNIPPDRFQDFDVTYFVADTASFTEDDQWLEPFGPYLILQKPEDMELFPPEEMGYSYPVSYTHLDVYKRQFPHIMHCRSISDICQ